MLSSLTRSKASSVFFTSQIDNNDNRFFHLSKPTPCDKKFKPDRLVSDPGFTSESAKCEFCESQGKLRPASCLAHALNGWRPVEEGAGYIIN
jgi:hypothetical protein